MSKHPLEDSRQIRERWIITGELVLATPTHLGNGDGDALVDMPLLLDEATGSALLTGATLAGGLRNYLEDRIRGYDAAREGRLSSPAEGLRVAMNGLLGGDKGDDKGKQSRLIVWDAVCVAPAIELRDGVKIDSETHAAEKGLKYDYELLEAGATFPLTFELLAGPDDTAARQALALALHGLAESEIPLGLRKRRGFGKCFVRDWQVTRYDLATRAGLLAWLAEGRGWQPAPEPQRDADIARLLGVSLAGLPDARRSLTLTAEFCLENSLLIRAGFGSQDRGPDTAHLAARHGDKKAGVSATLLPVLAGTSLAGALRGRGLRIARTIAGDVFDEHGKRQPAPAVAEWMDHLFGPAKITGGAPSPRASRLAVEETPVTGVHSLAQNRIRIDRFTGGAHETGLFNEQPVFGGATSRVEVRLSLRNPRRAEVGLLLLLLKDLWTGDLPLGGESAVGRGRLNGARAEWTDADGRWTLEQRGADTAPGITWMRPDGSAASAEDARQHLNGHVAALREELGR